MLLFKSIFLFVGDLGRALEVRSSSVSKQPFCRGKIHVGMIKWEQPRLAVWAQLSSSPQILHYPSHGIQWTSVSSVRKWWAGAGPPRRPAWICQHHQGRSPSKFPTHTHPHHCGSLLGASRTLCRLENTGNINVLNWFFKLGVEEEESMFVWALWEHILTSFLFLFS